MVTRDGCPRCGSQRVKKNGHIHNGKQNHQCKACERQFVGQANQRLISDEQRALVERLLLERISLRGICRAVGVGLKWFVAVVWAVLDVIIDDNKPLISFLSRICYVLGGAIHVMLCDDFMLLLARSRNQSRGG